MRILKLILDFYINSSIHVAIAVSCLSGITLIQFDISYDTNVLYFIFFATITGYNFIKYFGLAKFHHRRLANWLKTIQLFSLCCFIVLLYYSYQLNSKTLIYVFGTGIITFLYAIPFFPKRLFIDEKQNLRGIKGLKIYVIAFIWVGVTIFMPLVNNNFQINFDVIITAIQRFLFVIVLMFPFEIRDMRFDNLKLSTIPHQIGVKNTKIVGSSLLMGFFFLEFFKNETSSKSIVILALVVSATFLFLIFSKEKRTKYYSSFWVEALPILWLILMLIS